MTNTLLAFFEALNAAGTPAEYEALLKKLRETMTPAVYSELEREALRSQARIFGLDGFRAYYRLKFGFDVPPHMDVAVQKAFEAHDKGVPFVLMGARGFWKTVTFLTLDEYLIGHNPEKSGIITGANDRNCNDFAKSIAQTIEFHPEWKKVFPFVIPMEKNWGADGYWVRLTHKPKLVEGQPVIVNGLQEYQEVTISEWVEIKAGRIDPTFVGGGYASSIINGKHPNLFLHADDLHDLDSWKSELERSRIRDTYVGQISKTMLYKNDKLVTWNYLLGVPFSKEDTLNSIINTGNCIVHILPAMRRAAEGATGAVYIDGVNPANGTTYDDIKGWWILTDPENFGVRSVIAKRAEGKFSFWQMYMMDIDIAKNSGLKYYLTDHTAIPRDIPMNGGADPTTFDEARPEKASSFAHCHLGKLAATNQGVVVDGYLKQCTLTESKDAILSAQSRYPRWGQTGVEDVSVGKLYRRYLETDRRVRSLPTNLMDLTHKMGGVKSKADRFKLEVSPWLENGVLIISDEQTDYLLALRRLCDNFYDLSPHDEAWDAGDALYHAMKLFPELWVTPILEQGNIPQPGMQTFDPYKLENVWSRI